MKFAWTKIVRHQLVNGTASPDDPALADYWADLDSRMKARLAVAALDNAVARRAPKAPAWPAASSTPTEDRNSGPASSTAR
jgi:hypothetical protein